MLRTIATAVAIIIMLMFQDLSIMAYRRLAPRIPFSFHESGLMFTWKGVSTIMQARINPSTDSDTSKIGPSRRFASSPRTNTIKVLKILQNTKELQRIENIENLKYVKVYGNVSSIPSDHPVIQAMLSRWKSNSKPGNRLDSNRIALSIEGGMMQH